MANPVRGEVELVIGAKAYTLCLTLGALAEIEAICGDGKRLDARRLVRVLAALLRGGGADMDQTALIASGLDLETAAAAVAECFERAGR
jgi:hypothetical protein